MVPTLSDMITYLDVYLESKRFADDQNGVYRHSARPIKRLGIAIEPWRDMHEWARVSTWMRFFCIVPGNSICRAYPPRSALWPTTFPSTSR